jgi:hypothetical protein
MIRRRKTILALLCLSAAMTFVAQTPGFEGAWYGTITPPGAQFDIAVSFKKRVDSWTGTLLLENGTNLTVEDLVIQGATVRFTVIQGQTRAAFAAVLSDAGIKGEIKQDNSTFPFALSRAPTRAFQGFGLAIDPNELVSMMASFTGPPSERPFVPPVTHPAIGYGVSPPEADPVSNLQRDIQVGKISLKFEGQDGYLHSLLDALKVPVESQIAVFSKNSLQSAIISPTNPRMVYFNDSVSVAFVRGGFIEIASQDPQRGINFYMMPQQPGMPPFIVRRDDCLRCHLSRNSLDIPGMLLRSVYPTGDGVPVNPLGSFLMDHRTQFEQRWGGWYVTGDSGSMHHLGNAIVSDRSSAESMTPLKDKVPSDIVSLMVFQHQMHLMNLITRVGWEFRVAESLAEETGKRNEAIERQLRDATNELVDYLLFVDEAPLPNKIQGASGFAEKFAALGPRDSKGRSLRQFDLERRLMRYPCSYMVYSPAFDALPPAAKKSIYERMGQVMSSRLSSADRQAVSEILRETKKDLPENLKGN